MPEKQTQGLGLPTVQPSGFRGQATALTNASFGGWNPWGLTGWVGWARNVVCLANGIPGWSGRNAGTQRGPQSEAPSQPLSLFSYVKNAEPGKALGR